MMLRILIADDHPLFREALRHTLETLPGHKALQEASSYDQLLELLNPELDLVLMDLRMPGVEGFSGLVEVRRAAPSVPVIIVSASEARETISLAMSYGASAFIPKSLPRPQIQEVVEVVLQGGEWWPAHLLTPHSPPGEPPPASENTIRSLRSLTPSELLVLEHLAQGKPNKIIASDIGIKEATVKAHITSIFRKLKVNNRTQALLMMKESNPLT
ncbi:response regulator transcription factor [Magnetococcus sp. PR-3]|uniref:response regulator transcription factor n=1 Tax=Magnetococcus sp. PR-3 TaxID=3120355 RepID=UPI002FCE0DEC